MSLIRKLFFYFLYRTLMATWRVRRANHPKTQACLDAKSPLVLAHWHGDEYSLIHLVKPLRLATMTSTSRDGDVVDYLIQRLGGATSRGSSTRGGARALLGLVRLLRSGRISSVAVDGPRGPYHKVKPGVFELARLGRAQIVPVGVYCKSALRFEKAWNKAYLPLPFARIQIVFGPPIDSALLNDQTGRALPADLLADEIDNASREARKLFAGKNGEC